MTSPFAPTYHWYDSGPLLVALTGYGQPPDREASREAGFDHHIVKPVEWTVLAELLRENAGGR